MVQFSIQFRVIPLDPRYCILKSFFILILLMFSLDKKNVKYSQRF